jgi:hypothetical protein
MMNAGRSGIRIFGVLALPVVLAGLVTRTSRSGTSAAAATVSCQGTIGEQPPSPGTSDNDLAGVAVRSASDVWAVGSASSDGPNQTLIEHWDGSAWTVVPSPSPGVSAKLTSVRSLSTSNAWAVGAFDPGDPAGTSSTFGVRTLVLHWNGIKWTSVTSPNLGSGNDTFLTAVAASTNTTWAVGTYSDTGEGHALAIHCH